MAGEVSNTPIQQKDPIASLLDTINMYSGKSTTSTTGPSSSTTKSNITPDQLEALISSAMAPLSQAAHGAGISPYSDTTLALGRGQVAAEIGAKYAGTTTTESGKTSTQTTAQNPITGGGIKNALKASLTGQAIKGLAVNPITKALAKKTGLSDIGDKAADWIANLGTAPANAAAADTAGGLIAGDSLPSMDSLMAQSPGADLALSSFTDSTVADAGVSGASDAASDILSSSVPDIGIDTAAEDFIDYGMFFADGGVVSTKKYADGGNVFVDRFTPSSTKPDASAVTPEINALYQEIVPSTTNKTSSKKDPLAGLSNVGDSGGGADSGTTGVTGVSSDSSFGLSTTGLGIAAAHGMAVGGPMGAVTAMGMNAIGQTAIAAISQAISAISSGISSQADANAVSTGLSADSTGEGISTGPAGSNAGPGGTGIGVGAASGIGAGIGDAVGAVSTGVSSGDGGAGGVGAGDGGGGVGAGEGLATGGNINGPGTGTSDSILAHLSDGERVITAKTNEAVEKMFPGFFHMLEQEFNPQAAVSQVRKGQA